MESTQQTGDTQQLERQKIQVDRERMEHERTLKEMDLAFQREELAVRLRELDRKRQLEFSPLTATVLAALIGLLGTGLGAVLSGHESLLLQRQKFESDLVFRVLEHSPPEQMSRNLLFFVQAGYLRDPDGKIVSLTQRAQCLPRLVPPPDPPPTPLTSPIVRRKVPMSARTSPQGTTGPVLKDTGKTYQNTVLNRRRIGQLRHHMRHAATIHSRAAKWPRLHGQQRAAGVPRKNRTDSKRLDSSTQSGVWKLPLANNESRQQARPKLPGDDPTTMQG